MVSKRSAPRDDAAEALKALLIEATLLHHHVASATRALAGPGDLTNAQVSILRSLERDGAATVPDLSRERAIARQPVQRMVLELEAAGLLRFEDNPHHRRSRLVALTPDGRRRLDSMERRQTSWLRPLARGLRASGLRSAAGLLRRIRTKTLPNAPDRGPAP